MKSGKVKKEKKLLEKNGGKYQGFLTGQYNKIILNKYRKWELCFKWRKSNKTVKFERLCCKVIDVFATKSDFQIAISSQYQDVDLIYSFFYIR